MAGMTEIDRIAWLRKQAADARALSKTVHLPHEYDSPDMLASALIDIAETMERSVLADDYITKADDTF